MRSLAGAALLGLALVAQGCASAPPAPNDPLLEARAAAAATSDGETLGRWLLAELVAPGGSTPQARSARVRLDDGARDQRGTFASLARAVDDEAHGALPRAAEGYLAALDAARSHGGAESELVAWFVTGRLLGLRPSVAGLWTKAKPVVERAIREPGRIGFRARGDLVDWWSFEARRAGGRSQGALDEEAARLLGCIFEARIAGPFGKGAPADVATRFDAERPGPWPAVFPRTPSRRSAPRVLASERAGACGVRATGPVEPGVHYVETFLELDGDTELLLAVQGAWSVSVDDTEVLARDPRTFGVWPRFGVALRLEAGRHRVLARVGAPETAIRVLDPAGRPLQVKASADPSKPYVLAAPTILPDPNALAPFLASVGVAATPPWPAPPASRLPVDVDDPLLRFLAAELAHVDAQDDLASVLLEPLVRDVDRAAPLALATQATIVEGDPIFAPADSRDLALDLRRRAAERDARLWFPRLWLALDAADKQGEQEQIANLGQLALDFSEVPAVAKALATVYARLGYKPEHQRAVVEMARRFPDDAEIVRSLLAIHDESGRHQEADRTAERLAQLEPASPIEAERALLRGDLARAAELLSVEADQLGGQPRARLLRRISELLVRSGRRGERLDALERALADEPGSTSANMTLADARLAAGDHGALRKALVHAILEGAETGEIRDAIELVDGVSELEAYRLDAKRTIADYQASAARAPAAAPNRGEGNAARVLDYATLAIHRDGTARMLEHEILHMRSREAIAEHAEQRLPRGKLLRIRTIKADGRTFEPEVVPGKPTVTMPHLEVGDFIETETLYELPGDRRGGASFLSPRWFFREERVDYFRSEFVVVSPKDRPLDVETTGAVPAPTVEELGELTVRRWRVDRSPALPEEPFSARIDEFLPSVRVGWGIDEQQTLARLLDASTPMVPSDPRIVRIARTIATNGAPPAEQAQGLAGVSPEERAKRIYRWVLENVEPGRETDPRRSVTGKSGSRLDAFLHLSRLVGVDARHALVEDRLAPPPIGPMSQAERWAQVAVAVPTGKGEDLWTMVGDKYAPFGYLPSSLRGQPAVVLRAGLPRVVTSELGMRDGVVHEGTGELAADGSAKLELVQRYSGRLAIELREAIEQLPEDRLEDAIEAQLLPQAIPGGRLASLAIEKLEDLDEPLVLKLGVEVSSFAKRQGSELVVAPPFSVSLAPFASLERRETPLVLAGASALRIESKLRVRLPRGAVLSSTLEPVTGDGGGRAFSVRDRVEGDALVLERVIDIPASRIPPDAYPSFVEFARAADAAFQREIVLRVP